MGELVRRHNAEARDDGVRGVETWVLGVSAEKGRIIMHPNYHSGAISAGNTIIRLQGQLPGTG